MAVDGEQVLGSVTFVLPGSPYREIARDDEGEFRMLAVDPAARGRGVGQALVELCLRRSRELGYAGVRMSTMDRMTSAHRVYERLGFTRHPRRRLVARAGRVPPRLRAALLGDRPPPARWRRRDPATLSTLSV